jgi:pimeloyl-ACP methyl ester carboxylesterase
VTDRHTIDTTVGPLAVRVVGDGPSAVLWPSLFMDGWSWDRILPALAQDRCLIVLDGPGHGASGDPGRRYSLRECATAAGQVLARLAVTVPVDWVGNAWGGHVGLRFAVDRASQCRSLIMLGTAVAALSRRERLRTYPLLAVHGVLGPIELVLSGVTEVLLSGHSRANDPEAVDLVRDSLRRADRRMLRNAVRSISLGREDLTSLLPPGHRPHPDGHRQRPLGIHSGTGRGRRPPHPERANGRRGRRRLPRAARGANPHHDAHP